MTIDFTSQDALFGKNFTVYQNQMTEQKQQPPDIIEIGGVKYKKIKEPPTLSNKLKEWIETLNFAQSKEHKDLLVIEILNIVGEFIPKPYEDVGLPEYCVGFNDCVERIKNKLQ